MLKRTVRDCVYGMAIGDALGVPYEFRPHGSFSCVGMADHGTHNQPAGTWSDDTSMTLALCDSYRELGDIDVDDIRARFRSWLYEGTYAIDENVFDFGNATARALESGRGCDGERDKGNGSLMRTLPMAFMACSSCDIREVSAITHATDECTEACEQLVSYARGLLADGAPERPNSDKPGGSGGYVWDTFNAAIWCLEHTSSYRDCVLAAVNLGDDTDTTACVAGGLAGILYGYDSIPSEWIDSLRGKDLIDRCLFSGSYQDEAERFLNEFEASLDLHPVFGRQDWGHRMFALSFEMDCLDSFNERFGHISENLDALKHALDDVNDIAFLGTAVFSQWRYWTHWANSNPNEDDITWFRVLLRRMRELL